VAVPVQDRQPLGEGRPLDGLDERIAWRNQLVAGFKQTASGVPGLRYQQIREGDLSTYKDLTLIVEPGAFGLTTDQLAAALLAEGIDSRHYYRPPIHRQKAYAHLAQDRPLPVTDRLAARVLTVPLWSHLTEREVRTVADAVVRIQQNARRVADALVAADGS